MNFFFRFYIGFYFAKSVLNNHLFALENYHWIEVQNCKKNTTHTFQTLHDMVEYTTKSMLSKCVSAREMCIHHHDSHVESSSLVVFALVFQEKIVEWDKSWSTISESWPTAHAQCACVLHMFTEHHTASDRNHTESLALFGICFIQNWCSFMRSFSAVCVCGRAGERLCLSEMASRVENWKQCRLAVCIDSSRN